MAFLCKAWNFFGMQEFKWNIIEAIIDATVEAIISFQLDVQFRITHLTLPFGIGKTTALAILAGKQKPNLGRFDSPPDWQEAYATYVPTRSCIGLAAKNWIRNSERILATNAETEKPGWILFFCTLSCVCLFPPAGSPMNKRIPKSTFFGFQAGS